MAEQSELNGAQNINKFPRVNRIKRRTFLTWLGASVGAATLNVALPQAAMGQQSREPVSSDILREKKMEEDREQEKEIIYFDLKLYVDANNFPVAYQLKDDPKTYFSEEQVKSLLFAHNKAKDKHELEPAVQFLTPVPPLEYGPTPERPYVTEAPTDLMSKERLKEVGLTVVNDENDPTAAQILVREGAVGEAGVFEPLKLLNEGKSDEEKFQLHIVNLKGPFTARKYMSDESEYDTYRKLYEEISPYEVQRYQYAWADSYTEEINDLREQLLTEPDNWELKEQLKMKKFYQLLFSDTLSPEELFMRYLYINRPAVGSYWSSAIPEVQKYIGENSGVLFLCSPDLVDTVQKDFYTIYFDEKGDTQMSKDPWFPARSAHGPRVTESYPDTNNLSAHQDLNYRYSSDSWGFIAYHEALHCDTLDIFPRLSQEGKLEQSSLLRYLQSQPKVAELLGPGDTLTHQTEKKIIESVADEGTVALTDRAHTIWEESGYTDNSGYAFAVKVPAALNQPAGYMITEQQTPRVKQSDLAA